MSSPFIFTAGLLEKTYEDNLYLINYRKNIFVSLYPPGNEFYALMKKNCSTSEIVEKLSQIYEEDPEIIKEDLNFLIKYLKREGVLINSESGDCSENVTSSEACETHRSKNDFFRDISRKCRGLNNLYSVQLALTNKCNYSCVHCYVNTAPPFSYLDKGMILSTLESVHQLNALKIIFTGGEPMLHPDFREILKAALSKNFLVVLLTNGNLIDEPFLKEFSSFDNLLIEVSFYGREEVYEKITGKRGSFNKILKVLELLRRFDFNYKLKVPVMNLNVSELTWIYEYSDKNGGEVVVDNKITPVYGKNGENIDYLRVKTDFESIETVKNEEEEISINKAGPLCGAGNSILFLDHKGDFFPCVEIPVKLGSVYEDDIKVLWQDSQILKNLRNFTWQKRTFCLNCKYQKKCGPCIGYSFQQYQEFERPSEWDCIKLIKKEGL